MRSAEGVSRPKRAGQLLALLVSSLVALVAAEVFFRTFAPKRTSEVLAGQYPAMFKASDYLPYRLRENYTGRLATSEFDTRVRINSLGYRGEDFAVEKGSRLRVLVIGDSFTFGWGVEDTDTYAFRLQQALAKRFPGRSVEVINAGFAACYSPDTYYLYLKNEGLRLNPDLVIVGVFVGNDLDSNAAFENEWVEQDAAGLPLRIRSRESQVVGNLLLPREIPFRYRAPLVSRLHVFQAVADVWWELRPRLFGAAHVVSAALHAAQDDERVPFMYRLTYAERTEAVMQRVRTMFLGMKRLADSASIPLSFLVIPDRVQLADDAFAGLPAEVGKPQRLLRELFEREGLGYLDLLPWLKTAAATRTIYFPGDAHWNVLGHELAAERLSEFVAEELLDQP
jgi:hypothetical protein